MDEMIFWVSSVWFQYLEKWFWIKRHKNYE